MSLELPIQKFLVANPNLKGEASALASVFQEFALEDVTEILEELDENVDGFDQAAIAEIVMGFRKLVEAKDCFVRAAVSHRVPE